MHGSWQVFFPFAVRDSGLYWKKNNGRKPDAEFAATMN